MSEPNLLPAASEIAVFDVKAKGKNANPPLKLLKEGKTISGGSFNVAMRKGIPAELAESLTKNLLKIEKSVPELAKCFAAMKRMGSLQTVTLMSQDEYNNSYVPEYNFRLAPSSQPLKPVKNGGTNVMRAFENDMVVVNNAHAAKFSFSSGDWASMFGHEMLWIL